MNSNVLGKRIELLRTENNLNQIRLAKILNIGNTTLSQYESGKRIPSDEIKLRIAEIFGVSLDWLLGISDIRNPYASTSGDIDDILETIRRRPEMKALFSLSKNATKEDIERTVKIIEALIGD